MRILNLFDFDSQDLESQLLQMTHDANHLEAFKGRKLLQLVLYLQAQGPEPTAGSHLFQSEWWLVHYNPASQGMVKVWIDWLDFGPQGEGLPEAHYRMQISGKSPASRDARVTSVAEAASVLLEAFGWSA